MGNYIITLTVQAHNGEQSEPHNSKLKTNVKRDNKSVRCRNVISFCRYKGLGFAHNAFDRSNAMLALFQSVNSPLRTSPYAFIVILEKRPLKASAVRFGSFCYAFWRFLYTAYFVTLHLHNKIEILHNNYLLALYGKRFIIERFKRCFHRLGIGYCKALVCGMHSKLRYSDIYRRY